MEYPAVSLPPGNIEGQGVYTLHYQGQFAPYADLGETPIYVGQARRLSGRLRDHERSIKQAENLDISDFSCRWLVLASIWMGLTEDILIAEYSPIWNAIRGFGNHDQGSTRRAQQRSEWDTLHPGRPWAAKQQASPGGSEEVLAAIRAHKEANHG